MRAIPLFPVILFALLISCTPEETCEEDPGSFLVARFKTAGNPVSDTIIGGVTLFGIDETGSRGLIYDSVQLSRALLPLDASHNSSRFVLTAAGKADTLKISHTGEAYLVSYACGFGMRFTLTGTGHTGHMIDSLQIIEPTIDAEMLTDEEHIWIYF